jgi:lipid-A-disaccharide synthase-like uncharacterized protein
MKWNSDITPVWFIIGLIGESIFFGRFLVQWIATERKGRTVVPLMFWYLSIIGSVIITAYSIYRNDPVFILANTLSLFIYFRNLYFAHSPRAEAISDAEAGHHQR